MHACTLAEEYFAQRGVHFNTFATRRTVVSTLGYLPPYPARMRLHNTSGRENAILPTPTGNPRYIDRKTPRYISLNPKKGSPGCDSFMDEY